MYTKEQIQNAIERYNTDYRGYADFVELIEEEFFEKLDKEVLFTT